MADKETVERGAEIIMGASSFREVSIAWSDWECYKSSMVEYQFIADHPHPLLPHSPQAPSCNCTNSLLNNEVDWESIQNA